MRLRRRAKYLNSLKSFMDDYTHRRVFHRTLESDALSGRFIELDGRRLVNFGSCSYLGLETDPRLKRGAIEAIERYGAQMSSSRAYLSLPAYRELESLLDQIFGGHTFVSPNTTLAHQAAIPILVDEGDAIIVDHRVHATVRVATELTRSYGVRIDVLPHNDVDALETLIRERQASHRAVWYMADGVYSMHGDFAPLDDLAALLERYPCFHLYFDDAHGMSWTGKRGCGFVLSRMPLHPRMVVAVSLNKSFGAGGGALVFPDAAARDRVFTVGGPMVFTGPLQPGSLGAALASARIHLSPEIDRLQAELVERVRYFHRIAMQLELPIYALDESPTEMLGLGMIDVAATMTQRLFERGLWTNVAGPPATSPRGSGVRAGITRHLELEDLDALARTFAEELPGVLAERESSVDDVRVYMGLPSTWRRGEASSAAASRLTLEYHRTLDELDNEEWDRCFEGRGVFTVAGLRLFERTFRNQAKPEDRWDFHYFAVRDEDGAPVALTFFTSTLWKDDIFASPEVSRQIEAMRAEDPLHLTSKAFVMGCLLSEGNHLYLDRGRDWKGALRILLHAAHRAAWNNDAKTLVVRDLPAEDPELDSVLIAAGFVKLPLPESMHVRTTWSDFGELLDGLTSKRRYELRHNVMPHERVYDVEVLDHDTRPPTGTEWSQIYRLYRNVQERAFELNTFPLPEALFHRMLQLPGWELALFRADPSATGDPDATIHGFGAYFVTERTLTVLVVGLDYRLVRSHALYKCIMLHALRRAQGLGIETALLGVGTTTPKRQLGATARRNALFVASENTFSADAIAELEARNKSNDAAP